MRKYIITIASLVGCIIVLSLVQAIISSAYATGGITLDDMNNQISNLQKQNIALEEKVDSLSSFTHIASVAASIGFVEDTTQIVIGTPQPLALRQ